MSFSQVNALKHEGKLNEALQMARRDLETEQSEWTRSALFWVLRDLCRNSIKAGEDTQASALLSEMETVFGEMDDPEGYAKRAVEFLRKELMPHSKTIAALAQKSKDGDELTAYTQAMALHQASPLHPSLHEEIGWIIFRYLKKHGATCGSQPARRALSQYLSLHNARPSLLHSQILFLTLRHMPQDAERDFPDIFASWGITAFRDDDWKRNTKDGREFPSLVEKAVRVYISATKKYRLPQLSDEFMALLRRAADRYPDNDQLQRHLAHALFDKGHTDEALALCRDLLLRLNRFYVWKDLARFTADRNLRIAALCKAVTQERDDSYLGEIHLELARMLIEDGDFPAAKRELDTYADTYSRHQWKPKDEYRDLTRSIPSGTVAATDNRRFYSEHAPAAEEFVYAHIPTTTMVVARVYTFKKEGRKDVLKAKLVAPGGETVTVNHKQLRLPPNRSEGALFSVKLVDKDGRRVAAFLRQAVTDDVPELRKTLTGTVTVKTKPDGKRFGFVADCYVPANLLAGIKNGDTVTARALFTGDRWRVFAIERQ